jgi:hypothetical protein
MPKTVEAVPFPHEAIAKRNQEDGAVAGAEAEAGRTGPVPGPGPGPGPGPQLVTKDPSPPRRRPEAEDRTVVGNSTILPAEDETGAQMNGISYNNSLGE